MLGLQNNTTILATGVICLVCLVGCVERNDQGGAGAQSTQSIDAVGGGSLCQGISSFVSISDDFNISDVRGRLLASESRTAIFDYSSPFGSQVSCFVVEDFIDYRFMCIFGTGFDDEIPQLERQFEALVGDVDECLTAYTYNDLGRTVRRFYNERAPEIRQTVSGVEERTVWRGRTTWWDDLRSDITVRFRFDSASEFDAERELVGTAHFIALEIGQIP